MISVKAGHGNFYKVEGILIVNKLTGRKNKRLMQRLKLFKWTLITVMLVLLLNASAGPVYSARASISGTYTTSYPDYFDFAIEYNVTGASAKNREPDKIGSFNAHRTYNDVWVDPNVSSIRVHGTAYGRKLTGLSVDNAREYPGKITVSVSCGKEKKEIPISIPVGSSPPYSFDVSIPVPAGSEGQPVNFNITAGMLWPNGYFSISVIGNGGFDSKTPEPKDPDEPKPVQVTALRITNCPGQLNAGQSIQLIAGISPSNATNKKVNWSVNNQEIATIQPNGIITARAEGIIIVTATSAENPKILDQCRITISEPEKDAPTIMITNCPDQLSVGDRGKFKAAVNPSRDPNGKDWRIGWIVDNPTLMNINNDTGAYETIKPGQVTVTAFLHEKPLVQSHCIIMVDILQVDPEPAPDVPPPSPSDSTSHQPDYDPYEDEAWMEDYIKSKEDEEYLKWLHEEAPFEEDYMIFQHDPFISHGDKELPWWLAPTIETVDDAADYLPGKPIFNAIRYLLKKPPEFFQATQEILSIPTGWVGTFISHVQKLTGTELTIENVLWLFSDDPEPMYYEVPIIDPVTGNMILDPVTGKPMMETITKEENLLRKRERSEGLYQ
jgi:hypothetical protein